MIASQLSESDLATFGAGPLRPRFSRTLGQSTWSNGCIACGVLLGGFPLFEDFAYCQSTGVTLPIVASARIPLDVLYDEAEPEDLDFGWQPHPIPARPARPPGARRTLPEKLPQILRTCENPLGYAVFGTSRRRDSNPRPPPYHTRHGGSPCRSSPVFTGFFGRVGPAWDGLGHHFPPITPLEMPQKTPQKQPGTPGHFGAGSYRDRRR